MVSLNRQTTRAQNLDKSLLAHGRKRHKICGDGNCLFRSLAYIANGSQDDHEKMRSLLVNFALKNSTLFQPLVMSNSSSLEEHAKKMMQLHTWGTQLELQAAASLFQKKLYLFTQLSSSVQYDWIQYEPHPPHQLVLPDVHFPELTKMTHLELCHTNNNHFDCIVNNANHFSMELPNLPGVVSNVKVVL